MGEQLLWVQNSDCRKETYEMTLISKSDWEEWLLEQNFFPCYRSGSVEENWQETKEHLVEAKRFEQLLSYRELKQCENAMKQEIQRQKEMQRVLEKIIRNYEQTEQRLLRLQEEGTKPVAHTKILCINYSN